MSTTMTERANGFSLVEVIVALTILMAGVLALAGVMAGTSAVDRLARNRQEMVELAENKFEDLRAYATSLTADTVQLNIGGSLTSSVTNYYDAVGSATGMRYRRRWQVVAGPGISRQVTIRVEPSGAGRPGTIGGLDFMSYITLAQR